MSTWKVILATLVIFCAGLITGAVLVRQTSKPNQPPVPPRDVAPNAPWWANRRFLDRMDSQLDLTPEQYRRLEVILKDAQERTRNVFGDEFRKIRDQVRQELTPPQRRRFEELIRQRPVRPGGDIPMPPDGGRFPPRGGPARPRPEVQTPPEGARPQPPSP